MQLFQIRPYNDFPLVDSMSFDAMILVVAEMGAWSLFALTIYEGGKKCEVVS